MHWPGCHSSSLNKSGQACVRSNFTYPGPIWSTHSYLVSYYGFFQVNYVFSQLWATPNDTNLIMQLSQKVYTTPLRYIYWGFHIWLNPLVIQHVMCMTLHMPIIEKWILAKSAVSNKEVVEGVGIQGCFQGVTGVNLGWQLQICNNILSFP